MPRFHCEGASASIQHGGRAFGRQRGLKDDPCHDMQFYAFAERRWCHVKRSGTSIPGRHQEQISKRSITPSLNAAHSNASSVAVGRYKLTLTGTVDQTDTADYEANKIGKGGNQIMGFPREGIEGYRAPTGLVSKPAVALSLIHI